MATQLGDISLNSIEGTTLRGSFRSIYEKNVYRASPGWAASLLHDAFQSLHGLYRQESTFLPHIRAVEFSKPDTAWTEFTIEVDDAKLLEGLEPGAWESYYLG